MKPHASAAVPGLDRLFDRLDLVRKQDRRTLLIQGLLRLALLLLVSGFLFFLADWLLLSRLAGEGAWDKWARGLLLLLVALAAGRQVWNDIVQPLRTRESDEDVAYRIEQRHGGLRGRLVSTVQFAKATGQVLGSEDLILALEEYTVNASAGVDFSDIIDLATLKRFGVVVAVVFAFLAALGLWRSDLLGVFLGRVTLGNREYPTDTRIVAVRVPEKIAVGGTLVVEVELDATGVTHGPSRVALRPVAGGASMEIPLEPVEESGKEGVVLLRARIEHLLEDVEVRPRSNDARWPTWEKTRVLQRPAIASVGVRYHFPAYTGRAPLDSLSLDLRALEGTEAELTLAFGKALASAEWEEVGGDGPRRPVVLSADGLDGTVRFPILRSGTYAIRLLDRDGLDNEPPAEGRILALPDQAPVVRIDSPGTEKTVSANSRWPIAFQASDDQSLTAARLRHRITFDDPLATSTNVAPAREAEVEIKGFGRARGLEAAEGSFPFDLANLSLRVGERVSYQLEVTDNRDPDPQHGRSNWQVFEIAEDSVVTEFLRVQRDQALRAIDALEAQQRDIAEKLAAWAVMPPDAARDRLFQAQANAQAELRGRTRRAADVLVTVHGDYQGNRLGLPGQLSALLEIAGAVQALVEPPASGTAHIAWLAERLESHGENDAPPAYAFFRDQLGASLAELARIREIVRARFGDEISNNLELLVEEQRRVRLRTVGLSQTLIGKSTGELSDAERINLQSTATRQADLERTLDITLRAMLAAMAAADATAERKAELRQSHARITQGGVSGLMRNAADLLRGNRLSQTIGVQDEIIKILAGIQDAAGFVTEMVDNTALLALEKLILRQEALIQVAAPLGPASPPDAFNLLQVDISNQQEDLKAVLALLTELFRPPLTLAAKELDIAFDASGLFKGPPTQAALDAALRHMLAIVSLMAESTGAVETPTDGVAMDALAVEFEFGAGTVDRGEPDESRLEGEGWQVRLEEREQAMLSSEARGATPARYRRHVELYYQNLSRAAGPEE